MLTRRHFLTSASALCVVSASPAFAGTSRPSEDVFTNASLGAYTQHLLTRAHSEKLLGTLFMVFVPDQDARYLYLHKVVALDTKPREKSAVRPGEVKMGSFSLSFKGNGPTFPQGTYLVDHGTLGRFALFLVAGSITPGAVTFEATFTSL